MECRNKRHEAFFLYETEICNAIIVIIVMSLGLYCTHNLVESKFAEPFHYEIDSFLVNPTTAA